MISIHMIMHVNMLYCLQSKFQVPGPAMYMC